MEKLSINQRITRFDIDLGPEDREVASIGLQEAGA
jgi:hypothetical protein